MRKLLLVTLLAATLTGCHALPIILPAVQAVMALPSTLKDAQAVTDPIDTGIAAAVPVYQEIRARLQAQGIDKRNPTVATLLAYGDSIADLPVPKGPVGTAVWLMKIVHNLKDEYTKLHLGQ